MIRDMAPEMRQKGLFKDDACVRDVIRSVFGADNMCVEGYLRGYLASSIRNDLRSLIPVLGSPSHSDLNLLAIDMAGMRHIAAAKGASAKRTQQKLDETMMLNGHLLPPVIMHAKPRPGLQYTVMVVKYTNNGLTRCPMEPHVVTHQQVLDSIDKLISKYNLHQQGVKRIPYTTEDVSNLERRDTLSFAYDNLTVNLKFVPEIEEWAWTDFHVFLDKADLVFPTQTCSASPAHGDLVPFWEEYVATDGWTKNQAVQKQKIRSMSAKTTEELRVGSDSDDGDELTPASQPQTSRGPRRSRKKGNKKKR